MYSLNQEITSAISSLNSELGYSNSSRTILENYLEPIADLASMDDKGKAYEIKIRTEKPGTVIVATTKKLSNLRFRLKDLILEGIPKTVTTFKAIIGSESNPILLCITIINFLKFISDKSTMPIQKEDAAVLCWLYLAYREERIVSIDMLLDVAKEYIKPESLQNSLSNLENLGCITLLSDEIILNEEIVFEVV